MALAAPTMAVATISAAAASVTTAPFTPTAGALLVVHAGGRANVSTMAVPTIGGTGGLTWTQLTDPSDGLYDIGSGNRFRALVWATVVGGTPTANQTITATITNAGRMVALVVQITGHGGLPSNAKAVAGVTGSRTVTLNTAPAASSTFLTFLTGAATISGAAAPAGFTQIDDGTDAAGISWCCNYDPLSSPTSFTYNVTYNQSCASGIEITEAATGASRVPIRPGSRFSHMLIR
jgi:hypothetical protein